jgi:hypothetical protein
MVLEAIFRRFVEAAPACVMHRALMENIFAPEKLDLLFRDVAQVQYERELLFSTAVELTSHVVCRLSKNTQTAYMAQRDWISVYPGVLRQTPVDRIGSLPSAGAI